MLKSISCSPYQWNLDKSCFDIISIKSPSCAYWTKTLSCLLISFLGTEITNWPHIIKKYIKKHLSLSNRGFKSQFWKLYGQCHLLFGTWNPNQCGFCWHQKRNTWNWQYWSIWRCHTVANQWRKDSNHQESRLTNLMKIKTNLMINIARFHRVWFKEFLN